MFLNQLRNTSLAYIYQRMDNWLDHSLVFYVSLKDGILLTWTTKTPHLDIIGLQRETKESFGDPKYISILFLDNLIGDAYVVLIYVTYDPCITDRFQDLLDEWMDGQPEAEVLDYPWWDKNGNPIMVSN